MLEGTVKDLLGEGRERMEKRCSVSEDDNLVEDEWPKLR